MTIHRTVIGIGLLIWIGACAGGSSATGGGSGGEGESSGGGGGTGGTGGTGGSGGGGTGGTGGNGCPLPETIYCSICGPACSTEAERTPRCVGNRAVGCKLVFYECVWPFARECDAGSTCFEGFCIWPGDGGQDGGNGDSGIGDGGSDGGATSADAGGLDGGDAG